MFDFTCRVQLRCGISVAGVLENRSGFYNLDRVVVLFDVRSDGKAELG